MGERLNFPEFRRRAWEFKVQLNALKLRMEPRTFDWYPYDSLSLHPPFEWVLRQAPACLFDPVGQSPVADIGCADGEMAFLLESLGYQVDAIDYPSTNYNGMAGVRALKSLLNSTVEIHAVDLDAQFSLPREHYGLVLFLGVLYHLKNPYYALETLARSAQYCLLSTRVTRFAADRQTRLEHLPVAYLLEEREANDDPTNFWIFSEAGLRRILQRTRWNICCYASTASPEDSDPITPSGDERAFCLLESQFTAGLRMGREVRLLAGWHPAEQGGWRWSERRFSARIEVPRNAAGLLRLSLTVPDSVIDRLGSVTLSASVEGAPLLPEIFSQPGSCDYVRRVPPDLLRGGEINVEFVLDKTLPPSEQDRRELGLVVVSLSLE
jgi:SAM-dependent methyltransferase